MIKYDGIIQTLMNRQRLTITLREDLLKNIDEVVGKGNIRNRSHAIEHLLTQSFLSKINAALILAGGKGNQMKPLTEKLPKPLLPIRGKPILEHQIELLRSCDIKEIYIVIGYLGEKIKQHFGDGSRFGARITYIEQNEKEIGTGQAVYLARSFLSNKRFIMLYGDVLGEINLKDFVEYHATAGSIATVALTSIKYPSFYGVAKLRGEKVVEFTEKPKEKDELSRVISAGIFCFEPEIFSQLSGSKDLALERDVFPKLAKEGKLAGYLFEGKWFDIGTPEIYARAMKEWKK